MKRGNVLCSHVRRAILVFALHLVTASVCHPCDGGERRQCETDWLGETTFASADSELDDVSLLQAQAAPQAVSVARKSLPEVLVPPVASLVAVNEGKKSEVVPSVQFDESASATSIGEWWQQDVGSQQLLQGNSQPLHRNTSVVAMLQSAVVSGFAAIAGQKHVQHSEGYGAKIEGSMLTTLTVLGVLAFVVLSGCCVIHMKRVADHGEPPRSAADAHLLAHQRLQRVARGTPSTPIATTLRLTGTHVVGDTQGMPSGSKSAPVLTPQSSRLAASPRLAGFPGAVQKPPPATFIPQMESVTPFAGGAALAGSASGMRYCIPREELSELSTYLNQGWFNVLGMNGEPIFHIEVDIKDDDRVLEISKVYSPGHSEVLATVSSSSASAGPRPSRQSGQSVALPPDILEVCLQEGIPRASIESRGSGSYSINIGLQKAFIVTGDAVALQLTVVSTSTGQAAAKIERRGMNVGGAECLELVVLPQSVVEPVLMLACVLAIITLRSWPTQALGDDVTFPKPLAATRSGFTYPHLTAVAGVSSHSLRAPGSSHSLRAPGSSRSLHTPANSTRSLGQNAMPKYARPSAPKEGDVSAGLMR